MCAHAFDPASNFRALAGRLFAAVAIALPALASAVPAEGLGDELARCRAIAEPTARLKCYDLIAVDGGARRAAGDPTAGAAAAASAIRPHAATVRAVPASQAGGAGRAPSEHGATAPAATASFGLERTSPAQAIQELRSTIPGAFTGWEARTRWTLANGQVWQVADGSRAYYRLESPAVRITRGVLGSFFMEIEGVSHAVPVRRLE